MLRWSTLNWISRYSTHSSSIEDASTWLFGDVVRVTRNLNKYRYNGEHEYISSMYLTPCFPPQVHALALVLNKKTNELAKASVSKLSAHWEMIGR